MLTATYSIVAISTEQNNARSLLCRLQQSILTTWNTLKIVDLPSVELALDRLKGFDRYCHSRKVELYVIPAVRGANREIDSLIAELDRLSRQSWQILRSLQQQLQTALEKGGVKLTELCQSMELYCRNQMEMLAKEESELFPMVRRVLSGDDWFSIAAQFLSDDQSTRATKKEKA